jgi:hypothetical protein
MPAQDHEDFEKILTIIKNKLSDDIEFDDIRSIESNFDTKGMSFRSSKSATSDGTIMVGEDNGLIAVDISRDDGKVVSFILNNKNDTGAIENIVNWLEETYE